MLIRLKNVDYSYKGNNELVLKNISVDIDKKFTIITGASGSGKTTLLYALGGLIKINKGDILIDGVNINNLNDTQMAKFRNKTIGFVFQNYFLDDALTNLENVYLPALIDGSIEKSGYIRRSKELLSLVGLDVNQMKRKPSELSGGQQQRVSIARALINNPSLILLDEPTGNLDSENSIKIMELLKKLSIEKDVTLVLVTHDEDNYKYADQIISLKDGEIILNEIR